MRIDQKHDETLQRTHEVVPDSPYATKRPKEPAVFQIKRRKVKVTKIPAMRRNAMLRRSKSVPNSYTRDERVRSSVIVIGSPTSKYAVSAARDPASLVRTCRSPTRTCPRISIAFAHFPEN
jgi:hypothetical protein